MTTKTSQRDRDLRVGDRGFNRRAHKWATVEAKSPHRWMPMRVRHDDGTEGLIAPENFIEGMV